MDKLDASAIAAIIGITATICTFAGFVIRLMVAKDLADYDKELRKRLHEWRSELSGPIHANALEIERIKARMNGK